VTAPRNYLTERAAYLNSVMQIGQATPLSILPGDNAVLRPTSTVQTKVYSEFDASFGLRSTDETRNTEFPKFVEAKGLSHCLVLLGRRSSLFDHRLLWWPFVSKSTSELLRQRWGPGHTMCSRVFASVCAVACLALPVADKVGGPGSIQLSEALKNHDWVIAPQTKIRNKLIVFLGVSIFANWAPGGTIMRVIQ